jgi:hypothetical protein
MKLIYIPLIGAFLFTAACSKGQKVVETPPVATAKPNNIPFKKFLGINAFEWDFTNGDNGGVADVKVEVMRSFGIFRHYLDWEKMEPFEGKYTYNPVNSGGWNYDAIYERCKLEDIEVLSCMKNTPPWIYNTYPEGKRGGDNAPLPYGKNKSAPQSYIQQARAGFQFAARYGRNKNIDPALVTVNTVPRWPNDQMNTVKIGLGYITYMENDNERDKDWRGPQGHQSAEEYAANMSAYYDGHKGTMGKNVGVKTADPTMIVVMGGLSDPDPQYVIKMIDWCKKNRGYKADGSVNLCFDVINYHLYNNDFVEGKGYTVGKAPELCVAASVADKFVAMSKKYAKGMEVWITESGYDLNPGSPQRAIAIGKKTAKITQADWMLRSAFLYNRHGLKRSVFYMLDDVDPNSTVQYSSGGFADGVQRRPVADYFYQTKKLLGEFHFQSSLNNDPRVDVYSLSGRKIYVMFVPDEKGRTAPYVLNLGTAASAKVYILVPGADEMKVKTVATTNGKLKITLTETPVFVEKN